MTISDPSPTSIPIPDLVKNGLNKKRVISLASLPSVDSVFAPNVILRSPVFSVSTRSKDADQMLSKEVIYDHAGIVIKFTGYRFTQFDLDVWLNLIKLIRDCDHNNKYVQTDEFHRVKLDKSSIFNLMDRGDGGRSYLKILESIEKLTMCYISISIAKLNFKFGGHLISEFIRHATDSNEIICSISNNVIQLFAPGQWSMIHVGIRSALRRNALALWIHGYYSTHQNSHIPTSVGRLYALCGSEDQSIRSFKQNLKSALNKVTIACQQFDIDFKYYFDDDNLHVNHNLHKQTQRYKNQNKTSGLTDLTLNHKDFANGQ